MVMQLGLSRDRSSTDFVYFCVFRLSICHLKARMTVFRTINNFELYEQKVMLSPRFYAIEDVAFLYEYRMAFYRKFMYLHVFSVSLRPV